VGVLKANLGDEVKDVRLSKRLTDSAVCLIADDGDMDMHLQRLLKAHKQIDQMSSRVLEINPDHDLIKGLAAQATADGAAAALKDAALLLLDQARIMEGETPADPLAFARRLSEVMKKGLL
ncbi:molecular chaperone HtpG, partial [Weissella cibaria]|nr:molecular chaperone HtpG [Weissella cibaria]